MAVQKLGVTEAEFDQFISQPENAGLSFELVGGEIVEVVSNGYSSELGMFLGHSVSAYVRPRGLGRVTGADGGYMIGSERYIPDAAFISKQKQPEPSYAAYNPVPPDLAVEVLSPSNSPAEIRIKVVNYLRVGTTVWVVDAEQQRVEVYEPGQPPRVLGVDDTLVGGNVLPGFELAVREIFSV